MSDILFRDPAIVLASNPQINSYMPMSGLDFLLSAQKAGGAVPKTTMATPATPAGKSPKKRPRRNNRRPRHAAGSANPATTETSAEQENVSPQSQPQQQQQPQPKNRDLSRKPNKSPKQTGFAGGPTQFTPIDRTNKRFPADRPTNPRYSQPFPSRINSPLPKPGLSNEYVSQEIMAYYQRNRQTNENYKSKQILRQGLENTLKQAFPDHFINLYIVGSSTNGIGDGIKSVDICVISRFRQNKQVTTAVKAVTDGTDGETESPEAETQPQSSKVDTDSIEIIDSSSSQSETDAAESKEAVAQLTEIVTLISEKAEDKETSVVAAADSVADSEKIVLSLEKIEDVLHGKNFAKDIKVIPARVPIIKFKDAICNLDVTLNLNQDVSIRNSQLIRDYAKMDWRFPHLAMIMKHWAHENHIDSAVDKGISSYSWTLMVIHFLQVCEPPVLPCLQKTISRRYDSRTNIDQAMAIWRRPPNRWTSHNTNNLRQLLKALFRYYGYVFAYDQHLISVREGKVLDRAQMYRAGGNGEEVSNAWSSYLCVEEPFTRSNTTRSVHDKETFDRIVELFRTSLNALKGNRISLFNVLVNDLDFPLNY